MKKIIIGIFVLLFVIYSILSFFEKDITHSTIMYKPVREILSLEWRLLRKPYISRKHFVNHVLPIEFGQNLYQYYGLIEVGNRTAKIRLTDVQIVAAFDVDGEIWVLSQGFFQFNKRNFLWYRLNKNSEAFSTEEILSVPSILWDLPIINELESYRHKMWILESLYKSSAYDSNAKTKCLEYFYKLVRNNPRFVHCSSDAYLFIEFLDLIKNSGDNISYTDGLIAMLESCEPYDNTQIITNIALVILHALGDEGKGTINKLLQRFTDENKSDDNRVKGLKYSFVRYQDYLEYIKSITAVQNKH